MKTEVLVIGAGTAGLAAAVRLAQSGVKVTVVATGAGSLGLAAGTIDVLGYAPHAVDSPLGELPEFVNAHPDHPYALVGADRVRSALEWFQTLAADLGYQGDLEHNLLLPTALGALRPSALVPDSMAAGALSSGARILIASIRGFRDFFPQLVAANLAAAGMGMDAQSMEVEWAGDATDLAPQRLWRRLEQPDVRRQLAALLRPGLNGSQAVGLPAMLGRDHSQEVRQDLEEQLGRPVFEISTLPPSLPGLRVFDLLKAALRKAGGRLVLGETATGFRAQGRELVAVTASQPPRVEEYQARAFVLASGGVGAGGIEVNTSRQAREPVFDLPLAGVPGDPKDWFDAEYLGDQPFDRAGVKVDGSMRPIDGHGEVIYQNLHVVGAELAGAQPWREKSGEGISLATAVRAADAIMEEAR
jgi:glycerol-3-phosphate dehydrogenase subunit B